MVVAGIHQLQRHHLAAINVGNLLVARGVTAEARGRQNGVSDQQEVALALVGFLGLTNIEPLRSEPLHIGGTLGLALRVVETSAVGDPVQNKSAVGGIDHVGKTRKRIN